jgi:hypothetical protein
MNLNLEPFERSPDESIGGSYLKRCCKKCLDRRREFATAFCDRLGAVDECANFVREYGVSSNNREVEHLHITCSNCGHTRLTYCADNGNHETWPRE